MITKYEKYCIICGTPTNTVHHLVFGRGKRNLADQDGLTAPMCPLCHEELHNKSAVANALSRIAGQLEFEKQQVAKGKSFDDAREEFRKRYGVSYL